MGYILYVQCIPPYQRAQYSYFLVWFLKKKSKNDRLGFQHRDIFPCLCRAGIGVVVVSSGDVFFLLFFSSGEFPRLFVGVMLGRLSVCLVIGLGKGVQPTEAKARSTIISTACGG